MFGNWALKMKNLTWFKFGQPPIQNHLRIHLNRLVVVQRPQHFVLGSSPGGGPVGPIASLDSSTGFNFCESGKTKSEANRAPAVTPRMTHSVQSYKLTLNWDPAPITSDRPPSRFCVTLKRKTRFAVWLNCRAKSVSGHNRTSKNSSRIGSCLDKLRDDDTEQGISQIWVR